MTVFIYWSFLFRICRGFKALKQIVKLYYKMGKSDLMMESYRYAHALQSIMIMDVRAYVHVHPQSADTSCMECGGVVW